MDDNFIQLRVVYVDLPDMIQLGVVVQYRGWSASSYAYDSPSRFAEQSHDLLAWVSSPDKAVQIDAGADTGIGWMVLTFYTVDQLGHARCAIKLASDPLRRDARPEETWRMAVEVKTELGLIERFARECIAMTTDFSGEATLEGLAV
jgi:hypothetical protein